jgi:hypothetical protein
VKLPDLLDPSLRSFDSYKIVGISADARYTAIIMDSPDKAGCGGSMVYDAVKKKITHMVVGASSSSSFRHEQPQ